MIVATDFLKWLKIFKVQTGSGGQGNVDSVNNVLPDEAGNVTVTAADIDSSYDASNFTPTNSTIDGYLAGIDSALGVVSAKSYGEMYFTGNTTPTTVSVAGTPVKINATYSSGSLQGFTQSAGTLTSTSSTAQSVKITVTSTVTYNGASNNSSIYITLNGVVVAKSKQTDFLGGVSPGPQSVPVQATLENLQFGDQIEVWVANESTTDAPIVQDLNCIISLLQGGSSGGGTSSALPIGYIYGLNAQYASASTLTLTAGSCRDSANGYDISLSSPQTLNIATSGANGLDTGVEAVSTWYAVYVIADSNAVNPTAGLFSVSATSPTLPAGYDVFRRVGWVRNNSASNFVSFAVDGVSNTRNYIVTDQRSLTQVLSSGNSTSFASISLSVAIPSTARMGFLTYMYTPSNVLNSANIVQTGASTGSPLTFIQSAGGKIWGSVPFSANASRQIDYAVTSSSDLLSLYVQSYVDNV